LLEPCNVKTSLLAVHLIFLLHGRYRAIIAPCGWYLFYSCSNLVSETNVRGSQLNLFVSFSAPEATVVEKAAIVLS